MDLTIFPAQILITGNPQTQTYTGASIRYLPDGGTAEVISGFVDANQSPAVVAAIGQLTADALAQNASLAAQVTELQQQLSQANAAKSQAESDRDAAIAQHQQIVAGKDTEISTLQNDKTALLSQVDILEQELYDLQNPPAPTADWATFRAAIAVHPAYLRIVSHNGITQALNTTLVWVMGAGAFNEVPPLWNAIASQALPTAEEIAALNDLAAASQVPFQLNAEGLMGQ